MHAARMFPVLFKIGSFEVHSFGLVMVIAFAFAFLLGRARAPRYGLTKEQVADAFIWTLVAGVLGARLGFILQELDHYLQNPDQLFSLQFQGLTSYGGLIGGFIAMLVIAKRHRVPARTYLDLAGAPMLLGHAFGRVGCLLNGCCYGRKCDLPWGIPVENHSGLFHPAQVYDSLMVLGGLALLLQIERRGLKLGQSFSLAIAVYAISRFIYEFWRAGTPAEVRAGFATSTTIAGTQFTEGHVFSLAVLVAALVAFFVFARSSSVAPASRTEAP
jgi:phosphatidylglycerol---prolipoprotein diacylglyceryl transferase